MTLLDAIILGIVEGLTEFLPVSSTGHLILTDWLLGLSGPDVNAFAIVIQLGAILAVVALYKKRVSQMLQGLMGKDPAGLQLFLKLLVAFVPAAIAGLALDDLIEELLFKPVPVAAALIVGGIAMIGVEHGIVKRHARLHPEKPFKSIDDMTYQDAVLVGLAQCLALWPGTSRSMSTILGAQLRGFSDVASAEFSFLLALPTLGAATLYKLLKNHRDLAGMDGGMMLVLVGSAVSFVVAFLAMRWFVRIVTRHGMTPFGLYRIIVGVVFLCLAAWGGLALAP